MNAALLRASIRIVAVLPFSTELFRLQAVAARRTGKSRPYKMDNS
jgi:hypothetical protein